MATKRHTCRWRSEVEGLKGKLLSVETELADKTAQLSTVTERLDAIERKLALTNKQLLGPKTERMPTPEAEARKREGKATPQGWYTNATRSTSKTSALLPETSSRSSTYCLRSMRPS